MRFLLPEGANQSGSALIITLMVMASLTIFGIMSLNSSILEIQIGRNERELREAFYLAEGAVMEGLQRLVTLSRKDLDEQFAVWHHPIGTLQSEGLDFRNADIWDADGREEDNALTCSFSPHTYSAAVEYSVATGGSLIQTDTRLYQNRVYGLCRQYGADHLIEIGVYLRY
jgi:type II secretory pathway component PulK